MSNKNRKATVSSSLGDGELIFSKLTGTEEVSRLFEFEIELLRDQTKGGVDSNSLLGKEMTVALELPNGGNRYFNGEVVQFKHTGLRNRFICYRTILRPWLWYLTLNANCRIFQDKSVKDVINTILGEYSFTNVEYKLSKNYQPMDYCVQYRESDFDFISRLMEHNGIFYYFKHQDKKHILVITDNSYWQSISGFTSIPYYPPGNENVREVEHISEWLAESQVTTGSYAQDDFDFTSPRTDLATLINKQGGITGKNDQEIFDYPGKYTDTSAGSELTNIRLQESQMPVSLKRGQGNASGIIPGMEFSLKDHYFNAENKTHVILSAYYQVQGDDIASGMAGGGDIFHCSFTAIESVQVFRPQRLTAKPLITGSQTAIVVGKSGEEIWTDEYGRVKVQFHWDREGASDERSSCWIRVSHPMAGKNWGWISLPRIGQEVIVSFLEGDPDRPLITGRVYNDDQKPPYKLPDNQTQSGIKTRSSKNGSADNFNEIRFEDKKDDEELYVHAEKDYTREVENDETIKIGFEKKDKGDQTVDIYNDRTVTLDQGNDALTVKMGDHSIDIKSGKSTITAMKSIELKVGSNSIKIDQQGITIKGLQVTIQGTTKVDMKSPLTTVTGDATLTLKGGVTMIN